MAAEGGKIDPMHQFQVEPLVPLNVGGYDLSFTNSSLFMVVVLGLIWLFMLGGMKRELVPGRWQVAVEGFTGPTDHGQLLHRAEEMCHAYFDNFNVLAPILDRTRFIEVVPALSFQ